MSRKTEQKKERVVDVYELSEKRFERAKRETKRYKDMKNFADWNWLMRQVPGFWR